MIQRMLILCFLGCLLNQNYSFGADRYELHEAAKSLNIKSLATLLTSREVPLDEINGENKEGELPLILVLAQDGVNVKDQFTAASLLIKYGANVNLCQRDGTYPIHAVCNYTNNIRFLNLLLENKATVDVQDSSGETPLHLVAMTGNESYLGKLLEKKAKIHLRDKIGDRTPILAAANTPGDRYKIIKTLLEAKASPNDEDKFGSVLHNVAERNGDSRVIELLFSQGADLERTGKGGLYSGKTPLEVAGNDEIRTTLQRLLTQVTVIQELLSQKFCYFGEELHNEIQKTKAKKPFQELSSIKSSLENQSGLSPKKRKKESKEDKEDRVAVTIFVKKGYDAEKEDETFKRALLAAAYFPEELEPQPKLLTISSDFAPFKFVHRQLADALFYGHPLAKKYLKQVASLCKIPSSDSRFYKEIYTGSDEDMNQYEQYLTKFSLPINIKRKLEEEEEEEEDTIQNISPYSKEMGDYFQELISQDPEKRKS